MAPAYDFECKTCNKVEEHNFAITEDMKPLCEECGELMAKKFYATPAIFNGTGWAKVPKL